MTILRNVFCCGQTPPSCDSDSHFTEDETGERRNSEAYERQEEKILCSSTTRYRIHNITGEGGFGVVVKGVNMITSRDVAIKILKTEDYAERERKMLEVVSVIDPVKKNLVKFFETFTFNEQTCLVFEVLDRDLHQVILERNCQPLYLSEIRPIAHQLLTAFDALKGIGVVHSDLKPCNIMVTNHPSEPFRVKLIDFGLSFITSEKIQGTIQPLGYRAPEVFLGLPFSEAIDMWGLGCVLIFLCLAKHPFSVHCEYNSMRDIVATLGQPDDHVLRAGKYTDIYFKENQLWDNPRWWLKTPSEYQLSAGVRPKLWRRVLGSLDSLITYNPDIHEPIELEDQRAFVSLLKCLLQTDPERRISPEKALTHPFITMAHMEDKSDTSLCVRNSFERMLICQKNDMEEDLCHGGEAEEEPLATPEADEAEALIHIEIISHSSDQPQAASEKDAAGSAEEESAVSQGAVTPTEEEPLATPEADEAEALIHIEIISHSSDQPQAASEKDAAGSAEEESAVRQGAVTPTEEEPLATPEADEAEALIHIEIISHSSDQPQAASEKDAAGSAEEESAVSQGAVTPTEEASPNAGSPEEGPQTKVKRSRLRTMRKFFGRALRTLFGLKKRE